MTIDSKSETATEAAIKVLAVKSGGAQTAHEAMQYAQAALNLAHTRQVVSQIMRETAPTGK